MRSEPVFFAATKILAASVTGGQGQGMHESPALVAKAVDLAEQLVAEIEKREKAASAAAELKPQPRPEPIGDQKPPAA